MLRVVERFEAARHQAHEVDTAPDMRMPLALIVKCRPRFFGGSYWGASSNPTILRLARRVLAKNASAGDTVWK